MEEEVIDYKEKYIRILSDFKNLKRRSTEKYEEGYTDGQKEILVGMLPFFDSMFDYFTHDMRHGDSAIYHSFKTMLRDIGITTIGNEGEEFNDDYHNAIGVDSFFVQDDDKVRISGVARRGYKIEGRVIRHADVLVSKTIE